MAQPAFLSLNICILRSVHRAKFLSRQKPGLEFLRVPGMTCINPSVILGDFPFNIVHFIFLARSIRDHPPALLLLL